MQERGSFFTIVNIDPVARRTKSRHCLFEKFRQSYGQHLNECDRSSLQEKHTEFNRNKDPYNWQERTRAFRALLDDLNRLSREQRITHKDLLTVLKSLHSSADADHNHHVNIILDRLGAQASNYDFPEPEPQSQNNHQDHEVYGGPPYHFPLRDERERLPERSPPPGHVFHLLSSMDDQLISEKDSNVPTLESESDSDIEEGENLLDFIEDNQPNEVDKNNAPEGDIFS